MRFKRLDWGMYIRPRAGRHKKHWQKDAKVINRSNRSVKHSESLLIINLVKEFLKVRKFILNFRNVI